MANTKVIIKWLRLISSHFAKSIFFFFFCMTLLHAHAHYICIVCAKYQKASVKALVQVDFLMFALSKNKHNPYLIGKQETRGLLVLYRSPECCGYVKISGYQGKEVST